MSSGQPSRRRSTKTGTKDGTGRTRKSRGGKDGRGGGKSRESKGKADSAKARPGPDAAPSSKSQLAAAEPGSGDSLAGAAPSPPLVDELAPTEPISEWTVRYSEAMAKTGSDVKAGLKVLAGLFVVPRWRTEARASILLDYHYGNWKWLQSAGFAPLQIAAAMTAMIRLFNESMVGKWPLQTALASLRSSLGPLVIAAGPEGPLLTVQDVQRISGYLASSLFQHYRLYQVVFNTSQRLETSAAPVFIETAVPPEPMAAALPEAQWLASAKAKAEAAAKAAQDAAMAASREAEAKEAAETAALMAAAEAQAALAKERAAKAAAEAEQARLLLEAQEAEEDAAASASAQAAALFGADIKIRRDGLSAAETALVTQLTDQIVAAKLESLRESLTTEIWEARQSGLSERLARLETSVLSSSTPPLASGSARRAAKVQATRARRSAGGSSSTPLSSAKTRRSSTRK